MDTNANGSSGATPLVRRKRLTREQRQQILTRFHQSDLNQADFVAGEGIGLSTLSKWLQAERGSGRGRPKRMKFQEITLPTCSPCWALELVSPHNWTVRLAQAPEPLALEHLLRALPC
jgi:transposase-like protein